MATSVKMESLPDYRQEEIQQMVGTNTKPVRIAICQHCQSCHIKKVVGHFGQVDILCTNCNRYGPWSWRMTVRNPNSVKKGKRKHG